MKKFLSLALAACMCALLAVPALAADPDSAENEAVVTADEIPVYPDSDPVVQWAVDNGLLPVGVDPLGSATRRMVAAACYKISGEPAVHVDCEYSDVDVSDNDYAAICFVTENKIMNGYGNGAFGPDDIITREQCCAVMFRFATRCAPDVEISQSIPFDTGYTDFDEVAEWAKMDVAWAVESGIVQKGGGELAFSPKAAVPNTMLASTIRSYLFFIGAVDGIIEKGPVIEVPEHPEVKVDEDLLKEIMPMF